MAERCRQYDRWPLLHGGRDQPAVHAIRNESSEMGAYRGSGQSDPLGSAVLIAIWLGGFLAVLCGWCVRWWRISAEAHRATLLVQGREFEALLRMQRDAGITSPVELRLSRSTLEPGIFGIVRPVLLWPEGISQRLDDSQLQAVIAHELWHVRRRDNLAAVFHMLVEAIFWFHPIGVVGRRSPDR